MMGFINENKTEKKAWIVTRPNNSAYIFVLKLIFHITISNPVKQILIEFDIFWIGNPDFRF